MDKVDAKTAGPLIDERDRLEALDFEARVERFGWDELTVEQKIERMRQIVKAIETTSESYRQRLEQLEHQIRLHSHGTVTGAVLMPLDTGRSGLHGLGETKLPGGKVYY